ncbi:MAG TPA: helix-turn-helix domain-containing protein [Candidatus Dormibacteraeota bacterium]|nr:helix-turn-helix domain-containing protein [Candidatus Dormibacteraeota bacterium]
MEPRVGRPLGHSDGYEAQRELILRVAASVFSRRGFDAASMRDVAREARLSAASLYHYFSSKEALMEGLIDRAASGPRAGIQAAALRTVTVRGLLDALGRGFFLGAGQPETKRLLHAVFLAAHERPAWGRMYLERIVDPAESSAATALAALMSPAARRRLDPAAVVKQLVGALLSFIIEEELLRRRGKNHPRREAYLEQVVDVIASGVEAIAARR